MTATKIFWAFFFLDLVGLAVLAFLSSRGPSSPEGPVGGWLILIPPIVMAILAAAVLITPSDAVKMVGIYVLGFPWVGIVLGPVYSAFQNYQTERSLAGDIDFRGPQRKLAHAIKAHDAALVKSLLPSAGDLNLQYGDTTLLLFAVDNAKEQFSSDAPIPPASLEIVRDLLEAGARADQPNRHQRWPLSSALYAGPELTEMLLKAGANPNHLDDAQRPIWWNILSTDTDRGIQTLEVLLNHGADLTIRDREGGPVAWAAYHARASYTSSWRAVWMLIERGASWKDEQEFGQPVIKMFAEDLESRGHQANPAISEAMRKLQSRFSGG